MICIICGEDRPESLEHVFPYAVGGRLTIRRVCEPCNSWLGRNVDVLLTEDKLIQIRRNVLGLKGNSGKVPDALKSVLGTGILDRDEDIKVEVEPYEPGKARDFRIIERSSSPSQIVCSAAEAPALVEKKIIRLRKKANLPPLGKAEMEIAVAKEIEKSIRVPIGTVEIAKFRIEIDVLASVPALLKIAYEMTHRWLGDAYLNDPMSHRILAAIKSKSRKPSGIIGNVVGPNPLIAEHCNSLIYFAEPAGKFICAHVYILSKCAAYFMVAENKYEMSAFGHEVCKGYCYERNVVTGATSDGTN